MKDNNAAPSLPPMPRYDTSLWTNRLWHFGVIVAVLTLVPYTALFMWGVFDQRHGNTTDDPSRAVETHVHGDQYPSKSAVDMWRDRADEAWREKVHATAEWRTSNDRMGQLFVFISTLPDSSLRHSAIPGLLRRHVEHMETYQRDLQRVGEGLHAIEIPDRESFATDGEYNQAAIGYYQRLIELLELWVDIHERTIEKNRALEDALRVFIDSSR